MQATATATAAPPAAIATASPAKKPATPRRRVAQARGLMGGSASVRDAVAGCIGKALNAFALAQIAVLQADSNFREEMPMFDNSEKLASDGAKGADRPWQTFDNLVADDPVKAVTAPVTISTDVKMGLAALFIAAADLVNSVGKLPATDPLGFLAASPAREANVIQLMVAATGQMRHHLRADPLSRDLSYPTVFRQKLEALVTAKSLIDPGADVIARLFVDFLKVIAWHAGTVAYEQEHLTLNRVAFCAILAQMAATVPAADAPVVRDVLSFVRLQLDAWEFSVAVARAKKAPAKKAAAKKAAAKKAAVPKPAAKAKSVAKAKPSAAATATATAAPPAADAPPQAVDAPPQAVDAPPQAVDAPPQTVDDSVPAADNSGPVAAGLAAGPAADGLMPALVADGAPAGQDSVLAPFTDEATLEANASAAGTEEADGNESDARSPEGRAPQAPVLQYDDLVELVTNTDAAESAGAIDNTGDLAETDH